jgi:hypothetical protein
MGSIEFLVDRPYHQASSSRVRRRATMKITIEGHPERRESGMTNVVQGQS